MGQSASQSLSCNCSGVDRPATDEVNLRSLSKEHLTEIHDQDVSSVASTAEPTTEVAGYMTSSVDRLPVLNDLGAESLASAEAEVNDLVGVQIQPLPAEAHGQKDELEGLSQAEITTKLLQRSATLKVAAASSRSESAVTTHRRQFWNTNLPSDFIWLEASIWAIAKNNAALLECKDTSTAKELTPLFFVMGACPNSFCGMQAVMYAVHSDNKTGVDFWWVKPSADDPKSLEPATLCRHSQGSHKNDPGRSKQFYMPVADLFKGKASGYNGLNFGIEAVPSSKSKNTSSRAFIEQVIEGKVQKMWLTLVWQEEWTSNPLSRSKYIKGKVVYQKDNQVQEFHSKAYTIENGKMILSDVEDFAFLKPIPGNALKRLENAP